MGSEARTHYQVLGVPRTSSQPAIREAYLNLARLLHPDRHQEAGPAERQLAERRMREVNTSWGVLRDPSTRRIYDRALSADGRAQKDRPRPTPQSKPDARSPRRRIIHEEDLGQLDPDEVAVTRLTYHVITKGPLLVIAALALLIFVFTAYAKAPIPDPTLPQSDPSITSEVKPGT